MLVHSHPPALQADAFLRGQRRPAAGEMRRMGNMANAEWFGGISTAN